MLGSGLGVSLLPAMAVQAGLTDAAPVAVRHLNNKATREIVVAWRAGSSRETDARLLAETLEGRDTQAPSRSGVGACLTADRGLYYAIKIAEA
jgi:DNA-binding transcriptional LysR family regulator